MADECCKSGFKWDGQPIGTEGKLGENNAYITGTNKHLAVMIVHDIFGWTLPNTRLLADHFAKEANCTAYLPDFFAGEVIPEEALEAAAQDPAKMKALDLASFISRHSKAIRGPEIVACAKSLKSSYAKVGAVGYCYGGWACAQLAANGNDLVDCISIAHPSLLTKEEIDKLGKPVQILAPETDPQLTPELKEYCNRVIPGLGIGYQYDYYPGLVHGFAVKGDPKDVKQRDGMERAKNATVGWLNQWLH
ncbi:hypothetical protein MMC25_001566 [Agyrium rufum]|nr:hypothetical protein [Agyrium rufum]